MTKTLTAAAKAKKAAGAKKEPEEDPDIPPEGHDPNLFLRLRALRQFEAWLLEYAEVDPAALAKKQTSHRLQWFYKVNLARC